MSVWPRLPILGALARGTIVVLGWHVARLGAQLLWVILMARTLGVDGYGTFSGVAGLALALSGFAGAGLGLRMYQDVARSPDLFGTRWAQATRALVWSSVALIGGFIAIGSTAFAGIPMTTLLMIALAELVGAPIVVHIAFAYAAHGRVAEAAAAPVAMSVARVTAVVALPLVSTASDMHSYAAMHAATTISVALAQWARCRHQLTPARASADLEPGALAEGGRLASLWASGLAYGSLDKSVALRQGGADVAGEYTAAQRFASLVAVPIEALVTAAMPRLFRVGGGHDEHVRLIPRMVVITLGYGVMSGVLLHLGAGLLVTVLGEDFESAVPAIHVLSYYVPAYCMRILGAHVLLGYGLVRWRIASEVAMLAVACLLIVVWAPEGVVGVARALVVAEVGLAVLIWARYLMSPSRVPSGSS